MAKITVIIPCWNARRHLPEMLDSLLAQTTADWQTWVVDDHSTDGSDALVQSYAQRDGRIGLVVRDREPKGPSTCRNIGLDLAEATEYVVWADADDVLAPYCLEQRMRYLDAHPDLDFAVAPALTMGGDRVNAYGVRPSDEPDVVSLLWGAMPFSVWCNIYRTRSLRDHQLRWDEALRSKEDDDFNMRAIIRGMRYAYIGNAQPDYYWRVGHNPTSVTMQARSQAHFDSHLYLLRKVHDALLGAESRLDDALLRGYGFACVQHVELFALGGSPEHIRQLLDLPFVHERPWLRARMWLYGHLPLRRLLPAGHRLWLRRLFFPSLDAECRARWQERKRRVVPWVTEAEGTGVVPAVAQQGGAESAASALAPVIVFAYCRLGVLRGAIESLLANAEARDSELYVFVDAPCEDGGPSEAARVEAVRQYVSGITGFRAIYRHYAEHHQGLAASVIAGTTQVISRHGRAIVVEDDLWVSRSFLRYMNDMLTRYEHDQRVMQVCGWGSQLTRLGDYPYDAYLNERPNSWGWATWQDRWTTVDWELRDYDRLRSSWLLRYRLCRRGSDLWKMVHDAKTGVTDSWFARFLYAMHLQRRYAVSPVRSLVRNDGFGPGATHCTNYDRYRVDFESEHPGPFVVPPRLEPCEPLIADALRLWTIRYRLYGKVMTMIMNRSKRRFDDINPKA